MILSSNDFKIVVPCAQHDWRLIFAVVNEHQSKDQVDQCAGCLIVRHRYTHPLSPGYETIHNSPDGLPVAT